MNQVSWSNMWPLLAVLAFQDLVRNAIVRLHPRLTKSEMLEVGPCDLFLTSPLGDCDVAEL